MDPTMQVLGTCSKSDSFGGINQQLENFRGVKQEHIFIAHDVGGAGQLLVCLTPPRSCARTEVAPAMSEVLFLQQGQELKGSESFPKSLLSIRMPLLLYVLLDEKVICLRYKS